MKSRWTTYRHSLISPPGSRLGEFVLDPAGLVGEPALVALGSCSRVRSEHVAGLGARRQERPWGD